jgi:NAD(P)H-hydrate epimerase
MYYATAAEMEKLDDLAVANGLEIRQMMELAGWQMLALFRRLEITEDLPVVVVCGKGNKGGDGLAAARHLANHGWPVRVVLLSREMSADARHQLDLLEKMRFPLHICRTELSERAKEIIETGEVLIDALIGYRLKGSPRGIFAEAVAAINASGGRIIAYDLPTGVEASTGRCLPPCVKAEATLSLALPKMAFLSEEAKEASGKIFLADIGIPAFVYHQIHPRLSSPFFR